MRLEWPPTRFVEPNPFGPDAGACHAPLRIDRWRRLRSLLQKRGEGAVVATGRVRRFSAEKRSLVPRDDEKTEGTEGCRASTAPVSHHLIPTPNPHATCATVKRSLHES